MIDPRVSSADWKRTKNPLKLLLKLILMYNHIFNELVNIVSICTIIKFVNN